MTRIPEGNQPSRKPDTATSDRSTREFRCRRTVNDGKDRCAFRGTLADIPQHTAETGHEACITCRHLLADHEIRTCGRCVNRAHDDLAAILDAYAELPEVVAESGYRIGDLPGGDALVMLADGSMESPQTPNQYTEPREAKPTVHVEYPPIVGERHVHLAYVEERVPPTGREHVRDHWPSDPLVPLAVLEKAERDWRHTFGHPPAEDLATVAGCAAYLREWMWLAARTHDAFDEFMTELADLRHRITHVAGLADDPEKAAALCFDCGGKLERHYGDRGLEDEWTCRDCGSVYDQPAYFLALRAAADSEQGYVPLSEAARAAHVPAHMIRNWYDRGQLPGYCQVFPTHRHYVWWPAVHDRTEGRGRLEEAT